ncbi:alpha/beta fold hydrolase [Streptomyces sp. TRM 70361]|uniref:dienelactone hydrolase family protein n=1 Tax=Streptomyces sp. TRM 70361 TaxID=3116553 RepID=UPI002E7B61EC|nr:alpha/beta fold hydrolase [Streptomyces sp. TRM 70361]MEE1942816.1 alpha/beta fold hydrolase [Streptomyces sp. TRM 70361]
MTRIRRRISDALTTAFSSAGPRPGGGAATADAPDAHPPDDTDTVPDTPGFESPGVTGDGLPACHERLRAELTFPLAWGTSPIRDFRTWRQVARTKVEEHLFQPRDDTPFHAEVLDERVAEGVRHRIVLFNVTRFSRVRATVLLPRGRGPFPAVLLLHDHGSRFDIGKEKLVRPWYDETRLSSARDWAEKRFGGRFVGDELARRGYAVLAVDAPGWGDRCGLAYEGQQALAANLFHLGASPAGLLAREDERAAAFLARLPEVDGERVAALGFSMGAYRAWQVAALSDHVGAAVAACWMTGLKELTVPGSNTLRGQSAYFMLHPGLPRHLDIPDVASIAAPGPMLFLAGERDPLFTPEGVETAYRKLRAVWRSQNADERLRTELWPGLGHVFAAAMQDAAFAWLDEWVGRTAPGPGPRR